MYLLLFIYQSPLMFSQFTGHWLLLHGLRGNGSGQGDALDLHQSVHRQLGHLETTAGREILIEHWNGR